MNVPHQIKGLLSQIDAAIGNVEYLMKATGLPERQLARLGTIHDDLNNAREAAEDFEQANTLVISPLGD